MPSENEHVRVDFTDVTLVEKDGQSVAAHSVILRVIRPYSEIFLIKNSHPHPLVDLGNWWQPPLHISPPP